MKPSTRSYAFDPLQPTGLGRVAAPASTKASSERLGSTDERSQLERRHPAIVRSVGLLWGYPEMNEYFDRLWLGDSRAEPIDPEAMADLMLLARVHQELVPVRPKDTASSIYGTAYGEQRSKQDVWGYAQRMR